MSQYIFKPGGKKGRNLYVGKWSEAVSTRIDLPFTVESLKRVLAFGVSASPYTHQDIAHWCGRFGMNTENAEVGNALAAAVSIAMDVEAQWEMYLANTHSLAELQALDISKESMPVEWFSEWLSNVEAQQCVQEATRETRAP